MLKRLPNLFAYLPLIGGMAVLQSAAPLLAQKLSASSPVTFTQYVQQRLPGLPAGSIVLAQEEIARRSDVDKTTGLVLPKSPFRPMEVLPEQDPRVKKYEADLTTFLERRQQVIQLRMEYQKSQNERTHLINFLKARPLTVEPNYFATKVTSWNGDIFWAPASKTTDINLQFGDEARSVFGPIPPFDLTTLGKVTRPDGWAMETSVLVGEVEGNRVELKPNPNKAGSPLEYEHRDVNGQIIKWTPTIDKCDKPSLAGGVTPCGTSSRISRAVKGNVEWIALARKTTTVEALAPIHYWMPSDPSYALIGYIGFNRTSGEVVFFDGTYKGMKFNWSAPTIQPGGNGYSDDVGRALASQTYDATFKIGCVACHDNKTPRIITPYIKQSRVGYADAKLAAAFSLGTLLPQLPRGPQLAYRVVGTSYTAVHAPIMSGARMVSDPTQACTACHGITNNGTGRFASDAVNQLGTLAGDTNIENSYRTDWALRAGAGKIHPWMVPDSGNDISGAPPMLSDADWAKLKTVIDDPTKDPSSLPVYTVAPAPEAIASSLTRIADPSTPSAFAITVSGNRNGVNEPMPKEVHLTWKYLNSFGGVPERDDVRFNVAIIEVAIPAGSPAPQSSDFPTLDQAKGTAAVDLGGDVYSDGPALVIKDVSYFGHHKWTDATPATAARLYEVDFPASKNKRYLIRVVPLRYTFDQSVTQYSTVDHTFSVDVQ